MRNFFREIPAELTESATIDGATLTDVLFRIVVPLSAPVVATAGPVGRRWRTGTDWFFPLIFTPEKDKTVLQVLLRRVLVENQTSELELFEEREVAQHNRGDRQGSTSVSFPSDPSSRSTRSSSATS